MLTATPHPYQEAAIDMGLSEPGVLIAYEMGLGKTLCGIAIVEKLYDVGEVAYTMIVVPASLKYQWAQQLAKLTDTTTHEIRVKSDNGWQTITVPTEDTCVIIEGSKATRASLYEKAEGYQSKYIILSTESVVTDWEIVKGMRPDAIILDECTSIKTFKAQRTKKIKRLTAPHRIALTGTPMENGKPEEIYSIMQWVNPDILGRWDLFDKTYVERNTFGGVERYKNLPVLNKRLSRAMIRKTQKDPDVAPYMPKVRTETLYVDMDEKTRGVYKIIANDLYVALKDMDNTPSFDVFSYYQGIEGNEDKTKQGKIMARMQAMDMLLCHPDLVVLSGMDYEESEASRQAGVVKKQWPGSKYAYDLWQTGALDDVMDSPKLAALRKKLETVLDESDNNKIIVFSAWRGMLDIITRDLGDLGVDMVQYHGGMNAGQKAAAQARFMNDPDCRIFLSSHAGAYGADLYAANHLINFDLSWQAGRADQINARHVRAASTWPEVEVCDILVAGSSDERRMASLEFKRRTARAIVDNQGADLKGRVTNEVVSLTEHLREALAITQDD